MLTDLTTRHAGLKAHLYNAEGKLRSFVNVYVNDEDIRYLQKEQTPINARHSSASFRRWPAARPAAEAPAQLPELTKDDFRRYSRHLILPEVGALEQQSSRPRRSCALAPAGSGRRSRCILPPPASARSGSCDFGRRGFQQSAAADSARDIDVGRPSWIPRRTAARHQPEHQRRDHNTALSSENALRDSRLTTSSWTARTIS